MGKFVAVVALALLTLGCGRQVTVQNSNTPIFPATTSSLPSVVAKDFQSPLPNAASRITKKPFGIFITPTTSSVQPERFSGYHTGTDFELLSGEAKGGEPVVAVCNGTLEIARWASGYGGVAVQSCTYNGESITVIYGHLRLSSVSVTVDKNLEAGQQFAVLGTGYTTETHGERTHLHLGMYRGSAINIRGYVATKADLSEWLDPAQVLRL
jgi:murein DD-endopeptidase MepM/ murein hydrolase activator NlpD